MKTRPRALDEAGPRRSVPRSPRSSGGRSGHISGLRISGKNLEPVIQFGFNMPEELPIGWEQTTLGEVVESSRERALPADFPVTWRYVGLEHIEPQTMRLLGYRKTREARSSSLIFKKGDVLYGKDAALFEQSLGRTVRWALLGRVHSFSEIPRIEQSISRFSIKCGGFCVLRKRTSQR